MRSYCITLFVFIAFGIFSVPAGAAVIADHTYADDAFESIPSSFFSQAQSLYSIYYGHTSHGSQLVTGMEMLEDENSMYDIPEMYEDGTDLGDSQWKIMTGNYLDSHPEVNLVLWSWCGQLSDYSSGEVQNYLNDMAGLEAQYSSVTFVYMTGHLDGSGPSGTLYTNNNLIRDYCRNNNKVLYDFADIESYDPSGTYYPNADDACDWCRTWCASHQCPPCTPCAHSECFNCYRKGQAFWRMLYVIRNMVTPTSGGGDSGDVSGGDTGNDSSDGGGGGGGCVYSPTAGLGLEWLLLLLPCLFFLPALLRRKQ